MARCGGSPGDRGPPNHKLVPVSVWVTAANGHPMAITVTGVFQDEAVKGTADASLSPLASVLSATAPGQRQSIPHRILGR